MPRVALDEHPVAVGGEALRAERDRLIDAHALADDRGLADHDARAVVDEEARADLRARMDIDARGRMRDLVDEAREQRHTEPIQRVREPVVHHGEHARIAKQDFGDVLRGRIAGVRGLNVADEKRANAGQLRAELARDLERSFFEHGKRRLRVLGQEPQRPANLLGEQAQRAFERMADVVVDGFVGQIRRAVMRREHRCAQARHDRAHRIARRQLANAARMARAVQFLARFAQLGDDLFEAPVSGGFRHRQKRTAELAQAAAG
ncbi:Uncharacterised protein [Burkholderia pseudomallei]|nr:Uncharacterised protein [Burkholderia pseudomallei]